MSTLKTPIGKSDNFKGFLEFLLSSVGSSWMPHLNQSQSKSWAVSVSLFFFPAVLLVLLSLKLHSLKSAQYFTFPFSLHGKSACGVKSPSIGSGCPAQLCHVHGGICTPQSRSVLGMGAVMRKGTAFLPLFWGGGRGNRMCCFVQKKCC